MLHRSGVAEAAMTESQADGFRRFSVTRPSSSRTSRIPNTLAAIVHASARWAGISMISGSEVSSEAPTDRLVAKLDETRQR